MTPAGRGPADALGLGPGDPLVPLWKAGAAHCKVKEEISSQMTFQGLIWGVVSVMLCRAEADTVTQKKAVGGNVTLSCVLTGSYDILQVTWQKKNTGANLATYSKRNGVNIPDTYQGRLNLTRLSLNDTAITLWGVRIQDDGCYMCLFNTFPEGAIQQETCLTVYEKLIGYLHYTVSEDSLTATCSANAWPRPVISWIVPNAEGEKTEKVVKHPNGTQSVISTLHVNSSTSLIGQELICRVRHMEEDSDYHVKVKEGRWFSIPWLLAIVALVFILLVLIVGAVCWRRRRKKQSGLVPWLRYISHEAPQSPVFMQLLGHSALWVMKASWEAIEENRNMRKPKWNSHKAS
ncbi:OX-2 membrane glycoprotein-like isoform X2 [Emydura macquarii macquarii]|uniref:OX-2 membrane glycoprotein-like isoform X2 n=1 Tax=Emydura macquarii macquarii TaxID=1129001 RepID=UPI00352A9DFA